MKKSLQILLAAVLLNGFSANNLWAQNTYYWKGSGNNNNNWSNPNNWLLPPPAPLGASAIPTVNDNVIFDATSFTAASKTVTVDVDASVRNMTWLNVPSNPTLSVSKTLTIAGDLAITNIKSGKNAPGSTLAITTGATATDISNGLVAIKFTSTSTATTIKSDGVTLNVPVVFDGMGGRWRLEDNMTIGMSAKFLHGHVIALPTSIASDPTKYNTLLPPTEPNTAVTSPMLAFTNKATVSDASHASHVVGYVQKLDTDKSTLPMPQSFIFPTGNGTYYRPVTMYDPSSATGTFTARYISTNPYLTTWKSLTIKSPLNSVSNKEFWYFTATGSANTQFSFNYVHPDAAVRDYYNMAKWTGITIAGLGVSTPVTGNATWEDLGGTPTYVTNGTIPSAGGTSSSRAWFTIARRGVTLLPVRLVSFTAQQVDGQVQLKWQSSWEENTSHFVVEKSADGKTFSQVLTKKAQNSSTSLVSYSAVDHSPLAGTAYYRLKMVDLDETFEYSKMVTVRAEGSALQIRAYPNPSKGNTISIMAENGSNPVLKSVSDMFGQQVSFQASSAAGDDIQVRFTQSLPAGFYVATLAASHNGELVKVKFIVQ